MVRGYINGFYWHLIATLVSISELFDGLMYKPVADMGWLSIPVRQHCCARFLLH